MSSHVSDNHRSSDSNLKITNGWSIVLKDQQVTKYEIMAHNIFYHDLNKKYIKWVPSTFNTEQTSVQPVL